MIELPNGCRCSEMKVYPKGWNRAGASTKSPWRISYRFYAPGHPPKQVFIKTGFNQEKDVVKRRQLVRVTMEEELYQLRVNKCNPITGTMESPEDFVYEIDPRYTVDYCA